MPIHNRSSPLTFAAFLICTCTANSTSLYPSSGYTQTADITATTLNQVPTNDLQNNIQAQTQRRSSIAILPPRSVSRNDFFTTWNLIFKNWQSFPPSPATANAMADLYASVHDAFVRNRSIEITPANVLSFTYQGLRCTLQAIGQAVPWGIAEQLLRVLMKLTRAGFVGLYTVVVYFLKVQVAWAVFVVVVTVVEHVEGRVTQNIIS